MKDNYRLEGASCYHRSNVTEDAAVASHGTRAVLLKSFGQFFVVVLVVF